MLKNKIIVADGLGYVNNPPHKILQTLRGWENNFKDKLKFIKLVGFDDYYFDEDNEMGYVECYDFSLLIENNGFQIEVILNFREHENLSFVEINNEYCFHGLEKDNYKLFHKFQWECLDLSTEIQRVFMKPTLFYQPKVLFGNIFMNKKK